MRRSHLALAGCALAALFSFIGCGSDATPPPVVDQTGIVPPGPGPQKPGDGPGVVLAMSKLYLGETNRDGSANATSGWKKYGFNLDGRISDVSSKDLCKPSSGAAPSDVYPDGDGGIDNSFGKNILPIILGLTMAPSTEISQSIADGTFTVMLSIETLGADTAYNPLVTKLYGGADLGMAPKFDGTDMWPVIPELLNDPNDIASAKVQFPESYVIDNTWVSGSKGTVNLNLSVAGYTLGLTINSAVIAMKLDASHKSATEGTIAGVLETEQLISELRKVVGAFDQSLCSGPTVEGILNQIRQGSDILKDGTQDPSRECDGISIGIGYDMKEVQLGAVAPPAPPQTDPCLGGGGMGGMGGAGTGGSGGAGGN